MFVITTKCRPTVRLARPLHYVTVIAILSCTVHSSVISVAQMATLFLIFGCNRNLRYDEGVYCVVDKSDCCRLVELGSKYSIL